MMDSLSKKVLQYILAAALVVVLTWAAVGNAPLDEPAERPYDFQPIENPTVIGPPITPDDSFVTVPTQLNPPDTYSQDSNDQQGNTENTTTAPGAAAPSQTAPNNTPSTNPTAAPTATQPTAQATGLPAAASKAQAVDLYKNAMAKAKSANSFTAKKVENANMNVHTGEVMNVNFIVKVDLNLDEFFHNFVATPRNSTYNYGGGYWALTTQREAQKALDPNSTEVLRYMEFGGGDSVSYSDSKYWRLSPRSASNLTNADLTARIRQGDIIKMASTSPPASFLPPASFSDSEVTAYSYTKNTDGSANISLTLTAAAQRKGVILPDSAAMRNNPFVFNDIIKVTMNFNKLQLNWQSPKLDMVLNADGYPASVRISVPLGSGSEGYMSVTSAIASIENVGSRVTGDYSVSWTMSGWNSTATPVRHF
ncbi:MAG: hypothetical protein FWG82_00870 [Oscillospiraceae bacterium]|nr:hypothetical protein [Oscillospiraceae bacterium]